MKYNYIKQDSFLSANGFIYKCDHPLYNYCTLYLIEDKGLAVIQQRYDPNEKKTWWTDIDKVLIEPIYKNKNFIKYFNKYSSHINNLGLYSTVTIRQIMWALRMKPLKREPWETYFDKSPIIFEKR